MMTDFIFSELKVSWTKYDIVYALDILDSLGNLELGANGEFGINHSIQAAFLGIPKGGPLPSFWYDVMDLEPKERRMFAFFCLLFTSGRIATLFADNFIDGPFKGEFNTEGARTGELDFGTKEATNIKSLLVESGLSESMYRSRQQVPFDGSILLNNAKAGTCFKAFLVNLIEKHSSSFDINEFYQICEDNCFHKVLGLEPERFRMWLEGISPKPTAFKKVSWNHYLCFDEAELDLGSSKEIYIVGENGDGKTLLMQAIYIAFKGYAVRSLNKKHIGPALAKLDTIEDSLLEGVDNQDQRYRLHSSPAFDNVYAYGVHRGLFNTDNQDSDDPDGFMTLFDHGLKLRNPISWLKGLMIANDNASDAFEAVAHVLSEFLERKVEVRLENSEIVFYEHDYPLQLNDLSEGYRGVIILMCDLLSRLYETAGSIDGAFQQYGVVLIDEICQHLHPRWQKDMMKMLRDVFPNIQFIVSTHSPFVIQGASEDARVFRTYRERGRGKVSSAYLVSEMSEMLMNTLVTSSLFGMDDAAMRSQGDDVDTNDSFVMSRIERAVDKRLRDMRQDGHSFIDQDELDQIIDEIMRGIEDEEAR